jgi:hypothetical protein
MALTLANGCAARFEIPPQPHARVEVINPAPGQTEIVNKDGDTTDVVTPPVQWCFARARHFNGLVQKDCADIARETRP